MQKHTSPSPPRARGGASRRTVLRWGVAAGAVAAAHAAGLPRARRMRASGDDRVAQVMAGLTPAQRVGQLFMVGLVSGATEEEAAATNETISGVHAGNVVLYGSDWSSSTVVRAATRPLQALARQSNNGVGLFISGNQEGGQWGAFQAFYGRGFSPIPSPIYQAQGDPARLQEQARIARSRSAAHEQHTDCPVPLDTDGLTG